MVLDRLAKLALKGQTADAVDVFFGAVDGKA
jgi:hypothetical protein